MFDVIYPFAAKHAYREEESVLPLNQTEKIKAGRNVGFGDAVGSMQSY
jgi:hypothetical protein